MSAEIAIAHKMLTEEIEKLSFEKILKALDFVKHLATEKDDEAWIASKEYSLDLDIAEEKRVAAFAKFEQYKRKVEDNFDYEKERDEYLNEKYGYFD